MSEKINIAKASIVIAEEGSFTSSRALPAGMGVVIHARGTPQPYIVNEGLLIAERGSVIEYPPSLTLVEVNRGAPWPTFVRAPV